MKIEQLLEKQELLPRTKFTHAEKLAKEFVELAIREYGNDNAEVQAKRIAANFHKAMVDSIDNDLKFRRMRRADEPRREDRSQKKSYGTA